MRYIVIVLLSFALPAMAVDSNLAKNNVKKEGTVQSNKIKTGSHCPMGSFSVEMPKFFN